MVVVSCSAKLHAFALAEQLEKHGNLEGFFTSYASNKNIIAKHLVKRVDKEQISAGKIHTIFPLAIFNKLVPEKAFVWNNIFDKWVGLRLRKSKSRIFIGWSGMSLHSIRVAKKMGMVTILERGSTHIVYQNEILKEEYKRFGISFSIHPKVIAKELKEYDEADYISVPSFFVKDSFISRGVPADKLLVNPYGAAVFFAPADSKVISESKVFRIVYLGTLSIRKGLIYFFEALSKLSIAEEKFEVWFIGAIDADLKAIVEKFKKKNWIFFGKIDYYQLQTYLVQCDIGVQPSLEEGLSMVIPQMMSCGIPVIVTPNTGGENIITDNVNGFVVPVRSPASIAEKIECLYNNRSELNKMKAAASSAIKNGFTWNDYGDRYSTIIEKL